MGGNSHKSNHLLQRGYGEEHLWAAEDHTGCQSSELRLGNWGYNTHMTPSSLLSKVQVGSDDVMNGVRDVVLSHFGSVITEYHFSATAQVLLRSIPDLPMASDG